MAKLRITWLSSTRDGIYSPKRTLDGPVIHISIDLSTGFSPVIHRQPEQEDRGTVNKKSFSPERHQRRTQVRLIAIGFLLLMGIGGLLVWRFYGGPAAITAIACILGFGGILGLLWLILTLMELWAKQDDV